MDNSPKLEADLRVCDAPPNFLEPTWDTQDPRDWRSHVNADLRAMWPDLTVGARRAFAWKCAVMARRPPGEFKPV
jgi:hypothetical protein